LIFTLVLLLVDYMIRYSIDTLIIVFIELYIH
jgi:hypothetical protein